MRHIFLAKNPAQFRVHEPVAKRAKDDFFELEAADGQAVVARPLRTRAAASILRRRDFRHSAAAGSALDQEREEIRWPLVAAIGMSARKFGLPRLHAVPEIVIDDPQMRHLRSNPLGLILHPAIATSRVGIDPEFLTVPDQLPDISFVIENTGPPLAIAVNGRVPPSPATLGGDALRVQRNGDSARRYPSRILLENAPNDPRFLLDDVMPSPDLFAPGVPATFHPVSVGEAASALPVQRALFQPAMSTLGEIGDVEL
ncbi:hypothetical protein OF829_08845 [Sphingomonas sp. LB-2]|nr:hypothetical protein [Sphingomonas caeni]MCW3847347.1 hypothetical protein [Sphingomonas caeni]